MKHRRQPESGYALLAVMVMAAAIAVMLYREMPRVVFEGQRAKEELLVQRGEQYYRAIQLFVRRMRVYPPTIEALENTNNVRFLRRRYKDPMTGKDDWRLIHAGPGGGFTDSLTRKAPQLKDGKEAKDATATAQVDPNDPNAQAAALLRLRRGASDAGAYHPVGSGSGEGVAESEETYIQPDPSQAEPQDPTQQAANQQQGQTSYPYPPQAGQPYPMAGQQQTGVPYPVPGQQQPAEGESSEQASGQTYDEPNAIQAEASQETQPDSNEVNPQPVQPQPAVQPINPAAGQPAAQPGGIGVSGSIAGGGFQPGFRTPTGTPVGAAPSFGGTAGTPITGAPTAGSNPALLAIQQQLSGARSASVPGGGQMLGAGIAGVASKSEQEGIRVYKEKSKYKEWEFLYDPRTDLSSAMSRSGPVQPGPQGPGRGAGTGAGGQTK